MLSHVRIAGGSAGAQCQMLGGNRCVLCVGLDAELAHQNDGRRLPFLVVVFEVLGFDNALFVEEINAGIRDAIGWRGLFHRGIEDSILADDFRVWIGQQWKRDALPLGKRLEDCLAIIADGRES